MTAQFLLDRLLALSAKTKDAMDLCGLEGVRFIYVGLVCLFNYFLFVGWWLFVFDYGTFESFLIVFVGGFCIFLFWLVFFG